MELLEEQKHFELSQVENVQHTIQATGHLLASALLETILYDSKKHAALCQALIDTKAGLTPLTLDVDMATAIDLHQAIKQHKMAEEEMITRLELMIGQVDEPRIREILNHLLQDERRHHALLQRLSNLIDSDTTAYDEYLGLIQKYMVSSR
jgi:rubrerythrin